MEEVYLAAHVSDKDFHLFRRVLLAGSFPVNQCELYAQLVCDRGDPDNCSAWAYDRAT